MVRQDLKDHKVTKDQWVHQDLQDLQDSPDHREAKDQSDLPLTFLDRPVLQDLRVPQDPPAVLGHLVR